MPCCSRTLNFYCKFSRFCSMNVACRITTQFEPGLKHTKTTEAENFLRIISSNYSTEALHLRAMFDLHRTLPEDLAPHSFTRSLSKVPGHACLMLPVFDLLYIKCSQMFLMILHSISLLHLDSRSRTCR